jgi:non-ribosomal peptide synthetase component E (peptide arylation enzyme)
MAFSFLELLERRAAENPVEPAIIGLTGALTVADLVDGITKVANRFDDLKLKPSTRVLLNVANPAYRLLIHLAAL